MNQMLKVLTLTKIKKGKSKKVLPASLGHASSRMTEKYAKVVALLNRETAEKTTKAFNLFGSEKENNQRILESSENKVIKQKFEGYFKNHSEIN